MYQLAACPAQMESVIDDDGDDEKVDNDSNFDDDDDSEVDDDGDNLKVSCCSLSNSSGESSRSILRSTKPLYSVAVRSFHHYDNDCL